MDLWNIRGGNKLEGACKVQGSKNASLPIIAASLLSPAVSELGNVPKLKDVDAALRILRHLGCNAQQQGNELYIDSKGISENNIPHSLMLEMRSSVIFMGALLARCGEAKLSLPGGCQLGKRPIDLHISALRKMGAEIVEDGDNISCRAKKLTACEIVLPFPSVGATENIMLTATAAEGETIIRGAAKEPEIVALAEYLKCAGFNVSGAGSDVVVISGKPRLENYVNYNVPSDRIVAATLACSVASTGGELVLENVRSEHFSTVLHFLKLAGCDIINNNASLIISSKGRLKAVSNISTQPYPGFPTDAQPVLMAALLKADGKTFITENIFENRFRQVQQLNRLGADIKIDGKTAVITGVDALYGTQLEATDLRGAAALLIAGMCAEGETQVYDVGHIRRGYQDLDKLLLQFGADISIMSSEISNTYSCSACSTIN